MLLKALPGELLFGRLCRSLSVSGMPTHRFTQSLGLRSRRSFHPLLTEHLEEIAEAGQENPNILWSEQTLFPLWAWSMPKYAKELHRLSGPPRRLTKFYLLTGNHSSQGILLWFCPACAREDLMKYGVPYWRCEHQIPGVDACYHHHCRLHFRQIPPSPHIDVEFYPHQFHDEIHCANIEIQFSYYSSKMLTKLSHQKKSTDRNVFDTESTNIVAQNEHYRMTMLYASLNDLARHLWEENTDPIIIDKRSFMRYLLEHYNNLHPSWKLLLIFCLQKKYKLANNTSITFHNKLSERVMDEKYMDLNSSAPLSDMTKLMCKVWNNTNFIFDSNQNNNILKHKG